MSAPFITLGVLVLMLFALPPLVYYVGPLWVRWAVWWSGN